MSNRSITVAITLAMCIGMWAYVIRVANPKILLQATLTEDRAAELGDLYPSWYGTRQLVLHGHNPYGQRVSEDLQIAYYGNIAHDGVRNEQRFTYPAYVTLFLLPTVEFPFREVQIVATVLMAAGIVVSVPLWLEFIGWKRPGWQVVALMLSVLSCSPAVQALELQQLSTLVCAFLAAGAFLLRRRAFLFSGICFALASIKPQMVFLLYLWLLLWAVSKWHERKSFLLSLCAAVTLLIGIGEWMVPGWIGQFVTGMRAYRSYAGGSAHSIIEMFSGHIWGTVMTAAILLGLAIVCFKWKMESPESERFSYVVALLLAGSTLVVPPAAPYNHLLLLPGVLILLRDWSKLWSSGKVVAVLSVLAIVVILWPWAAAIGILLVSFFVPVQGWARPFSLSLIVPLAVSALLILRLTLERIDFKKTNWPDGC